MKFIEEKRNSPKIANKSGSSYADRLKFSEQNFLKLHTREDQSPVTQPGDQKISDFIELTKEIDKLNKLCDISKMLKTIKTLNNKLVNCTTSGEKLQAFTDVLQNAEF